MSSRVLRQVSAVQCPKCKEVVISRASHDFHACSCRAVAIDGGRDYLRLGYDSGLNPTVCKIELIGLKFFDLYQDWNKSHDKLGRIKTKYALDPANYRYTYNKQGKFYRYPKLCKSNTEKEEPNTDQVSASN